MIFIYKPEDFKLFIAPGNHDVGDKNFDSALNISQFSKKRFVFSKLPFK